MTDPQPQPFPALDPEQQAQQRRADDALAANLDGPAWRARVLAEAQLGAETPAPWFGWVAPRGGLPPE